MYEIKQLPIPKVRKRTRYPWGQLDVGESFVVPATDSTLANLRILANLQSQRGDKSFKVAKMVNGDTQVWREA